MWTQLTVKDATRNTRENLMSLSTLILGPYLLWKYSNNICTWMNKLTNTIKQYKTTHTVYYTPSQRCILITMWLKHTLKNETLFAIHRTVHTRPHSHRHTHTHTHTHTHIHSNTHLRESGWQKQQITKLHFILFWLVSYYSPLSLMSKSFSAYISHTKFDNMIIALTPGSWKAHLSRHRMRGWTDIQCIDICCEYSLNFNV